MFYRNGNPIGGAALEVKDRRVGEHVFTLLEDQSDKPSQLAPGRKVGRWMRVDDEGRGVDAETLCVYGSVRSSRTGWPMKSRRARP